MREKNQCRVAEPGINAKRRTSSGKSVASAESGPTDGCRAGTVTAIGSHTGSHHRFDRNPG